MHLTGWHLLLVISWVAGWISGATISIQDPEEMRWEDGRSTPSEERVTANSKPEKHQQFLVLVSVTVRVIIRHCPCTMCERHLAFFCHWREVDIGTLARCSAPPEGLDLPGCTRLGNVAVERIINGDVSEDPVWVSVCSVPDRCSVFKLVRIKLNPKVQFGSDLWKNGQHTIQATLGFKEQEVVSHTSPIMSTSHQSHCEQCSRAWCKYVKVKPW